MVILLLLAVAYLVIGVITTLVAHTLELIQIDTGRYPGIVISEASPLTITIFWPIAWLCIAVYWGFQPIKISFIWLNKKYCKLADECQYRWTEYRMRKNHETKN